MGTPTKQQQSQQEAGASGAASMLWSPAVSQALQAAQGAMPPVALGPSSQLQQLLLLQQQQHQQHQQQQQQPLQRQQGFDL
jgi:hypothetical protein